MKTKYNTKLKSYTIIEMLVVMLVSALSIGITYSCYTIVSNQYSHYKKKSEKLAQLILLDKLLSKDFSSSRKVERTTEGVVCIMPKETIRYEFHENYMLRRGQIVDTFRMQEVKEIVAKRIGNIENIPEKLVDELEFKVVYEGENLYFYHKKKYGADVLMIFDGSVN